MALGKIQWLEGELRQARTSFSEALELEPENIGALDTRGYLLYLTGKYDSALADMNAAVAGLEGNSKQHALEERLPRRWLQSGPVLTELIDHSRHKAAFYYHRGLVLLALGREQEANADLDRVRELIGREPDETLF